MRGRHKITKSADGRRGIFLRRLDHFGDKILSAAVLIFSAAVGFVIMWQVIQAVKWITIFMQSR